MHAATYSTTTLPVIFGCIEQKYEYVPGLLAVNVNFSSVSSTLDLKVALSSLTTVCGMSSALVQVICVPALTVSATGAKLKLSILTSTVGGPAAIDFSTVGSATKASTVDAATERIQLLLFILILIFLLLVKCVKVFVEMAMTSYSSVESINARA